MILPLSARNERKGGSDFQNAEFVFGILGLSGFIDDKKTNILECSFRAVQGHRRKGKGELVSRNPNPIQNSRSTEVKL